MLKLTYTENGFYLERLASSVEEWATTRVLLALRSGSTLRVEASTASFLLSADLPQLADLEKAVRQHQVEGIALAICDPEYIEISLHGTWLTSAPDREEGVFVVNLSDRAEFFLCKLWQESQAYVSATPD